MVKGDGPTGEYSEDGSPKYSPGLRISLGEEEIKRLLMNRMPPVGHEIEMKAMVKVVEVGEETQKGDMGRRRLVLQITSMGLYDDEKSDSDKFYGE